MQTVSRDLDGQNVYPQDRKQNYSNTVETGKFSSSWGCWLSYEVRVLRLTRWGCGLLESFWIRRNGVFRVTQVRRDQRQSFVVPPWGTWESVLRTEARAQVARDWGRWRVLGKQRAQKPGTENDCRCVDYISSNSHQERNQISFGCL